MNSHISIPESTLLRFSKSGILFFLDVKSRRICRATAKKFNTKHDYYDKEIENFLSQRAEQKMGRVYQIIERFHNREIPQININGEFQEFSKDIIAIQIIRNPEFLRKNVLPLMPYNQRYGVRYMANHILKNFEDYRDEVVDLKNYIAMFMLNDQEEGFLLPSMHFYTVPYRGKTTYVLILSPKEAIALIDIHIFNMYYKDPSGAFYPSIKDEITICVCQVKNTALVNEKIQHPIDTEYDDFSFFEQG